MQVPLFEKMDDQLLDALCYRLKPVLYTEDSYIVREGDPVDEMLFIMRGKLFTVTTNGGRTGFFNAEYLKAGDFCGEELLTWALDPHSSSNLPTSTRTVQALSEVEAFALMANDLKFVASQFRRLHSKQLRHTFRFYSQQWRTWAACFIQAAWRRFCRKKLEESLRQEENRLQDALARGGGSSPSLGATIYASRFAANALRALRRNSTRKRLPERISPILLQKPSEPDFTSEDKWHIYILLYICNIIILVMFLLEELPSTGWWCHIYLLYVNIMHDSFVFYIEWEICDGVKFSMQMGLKSQPQMVPNLNLLLFERFDYGGFLLQIATSIPWLYNIHTFSHFQRFVCYTAPSPQIKWNYTLQIEKSTPISSNYLQESYSWYIQKDMEENK